MRLDKGEGLSVYDRWLVVVTLLEVGEKEEGVVALHLPTGPLKTSGYYYSTKQNGRSHLFKSVYFND